MSGFHTTVNGRRVQPGMNRDLMRTLFSLGQVSTTREYQNDHQMAQEFGEDVYFTTVLTDEMIAYP